jgi:hypothetical protein
MPAEAKRRSSPVVEPRRPAAEEVTSMLTISTRAPAGLDWDAFSAAYFPQRRRHDLGAIVAYASYRRSESGAAPISDEGARALRDWEDEGGATRSRHRQ